MVLEAALTVIEPKEVVRLIDWACEYGFTEMGQPYSDFAYPHLGAPGGPFDAFDCDQYFDIWLQWASRLGKTFGGQMASMKQAATDPCPMMFVSSDEKLAVEVVERTYKMIEQIPQLADLLPPPNRRKQSRVDLTYCRMYVAWARSVSTLADKPVRFGHNNEIDKWEHQSTSTEADPLKLSDDRNKEFVTFKRWKEGTPAIRGKSRIERGRLASCNARYMVPCPHCGRYQILTMGDGEKPGGIVWSKDAAGKSDKDIARKTARYICLHCEGEIEDEHRGAMMRAGVWVPEGCDVDDDIAREIAADWKEPGRQPWGGWKDSPWITGEPLRDGRDYGSQLASYYALSRSWGDIAAEFVDSTKNVQNLRNFVNQWKAETWEIVSRKAKWEDVGERLIVKGQKPKEVPNWATLLTCAIDKQGYDTNRYPWIVEAWGPEYRSATIAYGESDELEAIGRDVLSHQWPYSDNKGGLQIACTLVDSGHQGKGVYEFVIAMQRQGKNVLASKGSSTAMNMDWKRSELDKNSSHPGMHLYMVDTIRSQQEIEKVIYDLKPEDPGGTSLYEAPLSHHEDFLQQLINDAAVIDTDKSNNPRESWQKIVDSIPNDYRDCKRYARVAMLIHTRGAPIHDRRWTPPRVEEHEPGRIRQLKIRGR